MLCAPSIFDLALEKEFQGDTQADSATGSHFNQSVSADAAVLETVARFVQETDDFFESEGVPLTC